MKSEFRHPAYIVSLGVILFTVILINSLATRSLNLDATSLIVDFFFLFIWLWMFLGEMRTKIVSVEFGYEVIKIRRYFGLGITQTFNVTDITGFKTSVLSSKGRSHEYLYLMKGDKKVAKLSEFYHSNYKELKRYIVSMNIKNIGVERFSNVQELKDIFS